MSRPELIKQLKTKYRKLHSNQITAIIDTFFESIANALKVKKSVELRGFGTFFVKEIKEKYSARNPKLRNQLHVPKKNKVRLEQVNLKEIINK